MLAKRKYPALAVGLKLAHPTGTDQYFAYWPDTGVRYEVNEVAFRMMEMMDGRNELELISTAIRNEFSGAETVEGDLVALLEQLVHEDCVRIEEK